MIPDIYSILTDLREGKYSIEGAFTLIQQHVEIAYNASYEQQQREELFKQVAVRKCGGVMGGGYDAPISRKNQSANRSNPQSRKRIWS